METTIKIYDVWVYEGQMICETGRRYSLQPWGRNTAVYKGEDDGGQKYTLPEGYETAETVSGEIGIYNADGQYCPLVTTRSGPAIMDDEIIALNKVPIPASLDSKSGMGLQ